MFKRASNIFPIYPKYIITMLYAIPWRGGGLLGLMCRWVCAAGYVPLASQSP